MIVVLLVIATFAFGADKDTEPGSPGRAAAWLFGFFGIGGVPLGLLVAVVTSSGAIAMAAIELIAQLHLGAHYPAWFPADALASGLAVGLLAGRLLAGSYPPED